MSFDERISETVWIERLREASQPTPTGRIGPYELVSEVERGGQGVVFRARQPGTQRQVALKRLLGGRIASRSARARFDREIEAVCGLNHPNIVTVFGVESIDGQPVLAMEWIDGLTVDCWALGESVRQRSVEEILSLFVTVCDAVHYAHQRGVIHRDLKPSNILVDVNDQPHVLDFGLAKMIDEDDSGAVHLTQSKDFVGTPAYASPEQVRGDFRTIDVRSDVYALGVLLHQMLTGRLPYPDDRNLAELLQAIKEYDPPPPSLIDTRLNREIDAIVLKALAKEPDRRFASVDGLAADVRRYLSNEPVLAHPPTTAYQFRKLVGRHRLAFAFSAALAGILIVFAIVTGILSLRLNEQRGSAVAAQKEEAKARQIAEQVNDFLRDMLAAAEPDRTGGREMTIREVLDKAAAKIDGRDDLSPEVESSIRGTIGRAYFRLGLTNRIQPELEAALNLAREAYGDRHVEVAKHLESLGNFFRQQGKMSEAAERYQEVYDIRVAVLEPGHPEIATALLNLGGLMIERHQDLAAGEATMNQALEIFVARYGQNHPQSLTVRIELAAVYFHRGEYARAAESLQDLLPVIRETFGQEHTRTVQALNNLAISLKNLRNYDEAQVYYEELIDTAGRLYGEDHPNTINFMGNLGSLYQAKGDLDKAEMHLLRAFDRARSVLGNSNATTLAICNNVAMLRLARDELPEAIELFRSSLAAHLELFGERHPATAISMGGLGGALLRLDNADETFAESESLMLAALKFFESAFPKDHPHRRKTLENLLRLYGPDKMNDTQKHERIAAELEVF